MWDISLDCIPTIHFYHTDDMQHIHKCTLHKHQSNTTPYLVYILFDPCTGESDIQTTCGILFKHGFDVLFGEYTGIGCTGGEFDFFVTNRIVETSKQIMDYAQTTYSLPTTMILIGIQRGVYGIRQLMNNSDFREDTTVEFVFYVDCPPIIPVSTFLSTSLDIVHIEQFWELVRVPFGTNLSRDSKHLIGLMEREDWNDAISYAREHFSIWFEDGGVVGQTIFSDIPVLCIQTHTSPTRWIQEDMLNIFQTIKNSQHIHPDKSLCCFTSEDGILGGRWMYQLPEETPTAQNFLTYSYRSNKNRVMYTTNDHISSLMSKQGSVNHLRVLPSRPIGLFQIGTWIPMTSLCLSGYYDMWSLLTSRNWFSLPLIVQYPIQICGHLRLSLTCTILQEYTVIYVSVFRVPVRTRHTKRLAHTYPIVFRNEKTSTISINQIHGMIEPDDRIRIVLHYTDATFQQLRESTSRRYKRPIEISSIQYDIQYV